MPVTISQFNDFLQKSNPLLSLKVMQIGINGKTIETLPSFLGIITKILLNPPKTPICFVFPQRGEIPRLVVILHVLYQIKLKQEQLKESFCNANFKRGDLVRVHPDKHVFKYDSFIKGSLDTPDLVCLEAIDKNRGKWSLPASQIIPRLEKTTAKRPLGRCKERILTPDRAPIDKILDTTFFGNQSILTNEVVLLDTQNSFKDFLQTCYLQLDDTISMPSLLELLPYGHIVTSTENNSFNFEKWDIRQPTGEPVVAVTHSAELLANYCIDTPAHQKLIVANGLSHLRNIQSYDDISQTQKLVLFCDHNETDMIQVLSNRGCRFWWLSENEINSNSKNTCSNDSGIIGSVLKRALNYEMLKIEPILCEDNILEEIYFNLDMLRTSIHTNDDGPPTKIISKMWKFLNDTCSILNPLTNDEIITRKGQIEVIRQELISNRFWFSNETLNNIDSSLTSLSTFFSTGLTLGSTKSDALIRNIDKRKSLALIARSESHLCNIKKWLRNNIIYDKIFHCTVSSLPTDMEFDQIICISWLGFENMRKVVSSLLSSQISVLSYSFEKYWLEQSIKRLKARPEANYYSPEEKAEITNIKGLTSEAWFENDNSKPANSLQDNDVDIWVFEQKLRSARKGHPPSEIVKQDSVKALYISFVGNSYAYLTETHKVIVANSIVTGSHEQNEKLPLKLVADVVVGDFVVFPESGDRDLVREYADKLLGTYSEEYRKMARLWKDALNNSELSPTSFHQIAIELGHNRNPLTIKKWFTDNTQIGPKQKDDLFLISLVTENTEFESNREKIWEAITIVRGAHLSAGCKIRDLLIQQLPTVKNEFFENGSRINLGELGSTWVVQVDNKAKEYEQREYSEINRLLWE